MRHSSEDELVLLYYGEPEGETAGHLEACVDCRERYQALQRDLNQVDIAPVPERARDYEDQVWSRLAPKLGARANSGVAGRARWWAWIPAGAVAALVIMAAFLAGRWSQPPVVAKVTPPAAESQQTVRERVLVVAVGDHLERSQMVIAELVNANPKEKLDSERGMAESLVGANRLYRQTATMAGDTSTASLLEDIERVLLEIAHSPDSATTGEVSRLRERVQQQGLLFRIRVVETQLKQKQGYL